MNKAILGLTILAIAVALSACASSGGRMGHTSPAITLTDYNSQNIDRVRDGVVALVGEDSVGVVARQYIATFENELSTRLPATQVKSDSINIERPIRAYEERPDPSVVARLKDLDQKKYRDQYASDQKTLALKRWLDDRKIKAIEDLRSHHTAFLAGGGRNPAKLGLAASYVAISCASETGDVWTISELVDPLLTEMKKQVHP